MRNALLLVALAACGDNGGGGNAPLIWLYLDGR